jgi:hypothetical protein
MRWTWDLVPFAAIVLGAFGGFGYACLKWRRESSKAELPWWRRIIASLGFLAVAAQILLFMAFWTRIGRDPFLSARWERFVFPTFVAAVLLIPLGKGSSRWWLLLSSCLLFVMCFFFGLTP